MPEESSEELQFDRVVPAGGAAAASGAVTCAGCQRSIDTEYYDINGSTVCDGCRGAVEHAAETPRGIGPFLLAGIFGFGAAIAGAAIYFAVMALANLEIGLIAILCGYMVGWAVRKGAGGRGGRRFQLLAVFLTYFSVALAYAPVLVMEMRKAPEGAETAPAKAGSETSSADPSVVTSPTALAPAEPDEQVSTPFAFIFMAAFIFALPVLVVVNSLPSGLITVAIIGFGMHQAWKMTGAPQLLTLGPYRVGSAAPV